MMKSRIVFCLSIAFLISILTGCTTPTKVEIIPEKVILEGAGATQKLEAKIYDDAGKVIPEGYEIVWFSEDLDIIKLEPDGTIESLASGEAKVEVEVVGTELKTEVAVRVKIPSSLEVSHEKLRLWTGQVTEKVWAEVRSEKGAFIEGYLPKWSSEDSTVVKVEQIVDANRRQSWVRMTGMKSGSTYISATFKGIAKTIRVAVYDDDEEVALDGTRIPKDAKKDEEKKK